MSSTKKGAKTHNAHNANKATPVVVDFLLETSLISQEEERVSLRALADRLEVSPPAVSRMAQRLARRGLLKREGACGLSLTDHGNRLANKAVRKRRVFEVFLVQTLGYNWYDVYPVAAASSNHLEDDLIERMFQQTGTPHRCPHGDPIPHADGHVEEIEDIVLTDLNDGAQGTIGRVTSHDSDLLRYLDSLGIRPGVPIQLVSRAPFGGPLRVRISNSSFQDEHVIGAELAAKIRVE